MAELLSKHEFTVIEVYSRQCPGCKRIDPLMPSLKERLGKAGQLVRMDALNECGMVRRYVEKTPTFLVYCRKTGRVEEVES